MDHGLCTRVDIGRRQTINSNKFEEVRFGPEEEGEYGRVNFNCLLGYIINDIPDTVPSRKKNYSTTRSLSLSFPHPILWRFSIGPPRLYPPLFPPLKSSDFFFRLIDIIPVPFDIKNLAKESLLILPNDFDGVITFT